MQDFIEELKEPIDEPIKDEDPSKLSLSIIIVAFNSASTIADCLNSVKSNDLGKEEIEIIVIDNASPDKTKKIIKEQFPEINLIENTANLGFAAAVNRGAEKAKGRYLVLLNPDTKVEKNFVSKLCNYVTGNHLAVVTGSNLVDARGKHQASCWKKPTMMRTVLEMFLPYEMSIQLLTEHHLLPSEVEMVSGACMTIRRDLWDRLKGFDAEFFMYYEDADFCFRARDQGYKIFYHPSINVYHKVSGSVANPHSLIHYYFTSKILFFEKHYSARYTLIVKMIIYTGIIVRIPVYAIVGAATRNKKLSDLAKLFLGVLSGRKA